MRLVRIALSLVLFIVTRAFSQQITVKLLDGRNGHPLKGAVIDIWFGDHASGVPLQPRMGQDGTTLVTAPQSEKTFVAAGDWLADCRGGNEPGKSYIDRYVYSVDQALIAGIVSENRCGKATARPVPGTFTFFVRPMHWWEKMRE